MPLLSPNSIIIPSRTSAYSGRWNSANTPYPAGSLVTEGPFVFGSNVVTSTEPCFDFGNLGDSAIWQVNGSGTSQVTSDPGDGGGGYAVLTNSVNSETNNVIYKGSAVSGWDQRLLIVDAWSNGTADAINFGIMDGSLSTTQTGSLINITGAWGVELQFYSGAPYLGPVVNGVLGTTTTMTTGIVNDQVSMTLLNGAGTTYFPTRYALQFTDNGSSMSMSLYREVKAAELDFPNSGQTTFGSSHSTTKKWVLWMTWTGLTRPSFTNWRPVVGAHTGGANSRNQAHHAWAVSTNGDWSILSEQPFWWIKQPSSTSVTPPPIAAGAGVAGYLTVAGAYITSDATPTTVNCSTDGTLDWIAPIGTPDTGYKWTGVTAHTKNLGPHWLMDGLSVIGTTNGTGSAFFTTFSTIKRNTTASDDSTGTALVNNQTVPYMNTGGLSTPGAGWRIVVPADTGLKTMTIYVGQYSGDLTCTAHLTDGSAPDASATTVIAASTNSEQKFTINYSSAGSGYLVVVIQITADHGGSNIGLAAVTLAGTCQGGVTGSLAYTDTRYSPDVDPVTPTTYDDEFNATTLGTKWAVFNSADLATTPYVMGSSSVVVTKKASTSTLSGYTQSFSPGSSDWTFQAKMGLALVNVTGGAAFPNVGLVVTDGTKYILAGFFFNNTANPSLGIHLWTNTTTFSSNLATGGSGIFPQYGGLVSGGATYPLPAWVRIQRSGSDIILSYSPNGYDWGTLTATGAISNLSTITGIGMGMQNNNTSAISPRYFHFRKIA